MNLWDHCYVLLGFLMKATVEFVLGCCAGPSFHLMKVTGGNLIVQDVKGHLSIHGSEYLVLSRKVCWYIQEYRLKPHSPETSQTFSPTTVQLACGRWFPTQFKPQNNIQVLFAVGPHWLDFKYIFHCVFWFDYATVSIFCMLWSK